jgi:hypothetical protein
MDPFKNSIPSPDQFTKDAGVPDGMDLVKVAQSNGDLYGMSEADMENGFDQTDYDQAGNAMLLPTGRVPTKRIDA